MARASNNDSIWEFIDSFRQEIKQKIINSKGYVKNFIQQSSVWLAQQLSGFKAKAARFIQWSAQNLRTSFIYAWQKLSYLLRNFPQILNQTLRWCGNVLVRGFETGYRLTSAFLRFLAQELRNLPARVAEFAKECVRLLKQGFEAGKWLIKNTFSILKLIAIELKDLIVAGVKNLGKIGRYVFNNFGTLARHFLNGLYQALKELPQIALDLGRFLKNVTVDLAKGLYHLGKDVLLNLGPFLKELSLETLRAIRWVATTAVKKIWNGVGLTLGAIAAVFDLGVEAVKSVFGSSAPRHPVARHSHGTSHANDKEAIEISPRTVTPLFRGRVETVRETFSQTNQVNVQDARHENRLRRA
jgi:hypothetical protein